jgi:hypothetical protein
MTAEQAYSKPSNAKRAAIAAGHKEGEFSVYKIADGKFGWRVTAPTKAAPKSRGTSHDYWNVPPTGKAAKAPSKAAKAPSKAAKARAAYPLSLSDKAAKAPRPLGKRAAIQAAALAGKLPPPLDFSAPTHARFRAAAEELAALAKAGDIKALEAVVIKPYSSSPKAMAKYRDLAVVALKARRAAAKTVSPFRL